MRYRQICEVNTQCLKTPISIVFTQYEPERRFTEMLISSDVAPHIDAWVKSRDTGFYGIEYQLNKGSAVQEFNPDFLSYQVIMLLSLKRSQMEMIAILIVQNTRLLSVILIY